MSTPEIKITPGDIVQMQMPNHEESRYFVKVIGFLAGHTLLVTTPATKGAPMVIREGQHVTVRLLSKNTVYGFESHVVKVTLMPYPYLHLKFPDAMESQVVRNAQRAATHIIASIENPNIPETAQKGLPALIANLSTTGASLESPKKLGAAGDNIVIHSKFSVGKIDKYLAIAGVIRNIRDKPHSETPMLQYGIEFQLLTPEDQLVLHGYVYEQIAIGKAI